MSMQKLEPLRSTPAGVLEIAWYAAGPDSGPPVFLMHGFPYDTHAYAEVLGRARGVRGRSPVA